MREKQQRKTLVILSPGFPASEADSVMIPTKQVFIQQLNKNFPELNIVILAFRLPDFEGIYNWHQNTVIAFGKTKRGKFNTLLRWLRIWKELGRLNKEFKIIGLLSFWCNEGALLGEYFGRTKGIKHYSWISGQDAKAENKLVRLINPKAAALVAMSDFLVKEFRKNHKIKPKHVIPNGIDPELFERQPGLREIDILGAGSLSRQKHFEIFIEVVHELRSHLPAVRATICGGGEDEKKLKSLIESLKLEKHVSLAGTMEHSNTLKMMQISKVFLHPSSYEGFSTVCIEALYAGAHVISFCRPMDAEIKNWHIVNTKEEMVNKALEILTNGQTEYQPVIPYLMSDSAKAFMNLFEYS